MKVKLSKRGDYVVRSAICLATHFDADQPTKLRQVSVEMGVPRTFVSQILGNLVQAGIATSYFGANGGYRLTRPPGDITLLEVVEAGEGSLETDACVLGDEPCQWETVCPVHETWSKATAALRSELATTTLATLVERDRMITAGTYHVVGHRHAGPESIDVRDTVHVERPADAVTRRLTGGAWLIPHLDAAREDAESVVVRVGPGSRGWLAKTVAVHLGDPVTTEEGVAIPLQWEATGPTGLFPRLVGTLVVAELDPERCELTLVGRYRPPLGRAGHALDEAGLSRLARATVRAFLRRLAAAFEDDGAQP